jgi:hypothetical protein
VSLKAEKVWIVAVSPNWKLMLARVWLVVITVVLHGCSRTTVNGCVSVIVRSVRLNPTTRLTV